MPAKWKQYGNWAEMNRNIKMLVEHRPDLVIAFPGGSGTANMCRLAEDDGVPVQRLKVMEVPVDPSQPTLKDGDYYATQTLLGGMPDRNRRHTGSHFNCSSGESKWIR
jgi:hypothetical protein